MLATSRTHKLNGSGYGEGLAGSLKKAGERWHKDIQQQIHTRQNKWHSQNCNTIMTKQGGKPLKHSVNNERNKQIKQKGPCPSESHSSTSFSPFSLSLDYAAFQLQAGAENDVTPEFQPRSSTSRKNKKGCFSKVNTSWHQLHYTLFWTYKHHSNIYR